MSEDKKTVFINTAKRVGSGILAFAVDLVVTSRPSSPLENLFGNRTYATDSYLSNSRREEEHRHQLKVKEAEHKHEEEMLKLQIQLAEAQAKLQEKSAEEPKPKPEQSA